MLNGGERRAVVRRREWEEVTHKTDQKRMMQLSEPLREYTFHQAKVLEVSEHRIVYPGKEGRKLFDGATVWSLANLLLDYCYYYSA